MQILVALQQCGWSQQMRACIYGSWVPFLDSCCASTSRLILTIYTSLDVFLHKDMTQGSHWYYWEWRVNPQLFWGGGINRQVKRTKILKLSYYPNCDSNSNQIFAAIKIFKYSPWMDPNVSNKSKMADSSILKRIIATIWPNFIKFHTVT